MIIPNTPLFLFRLHHPIDLFSVIYYQVAGYAVGGGHVLHMVCDITIAADNAIFGQTGPKVIFWSKTCIFLSMDADWKAYHLYLFIKCEIPKILISFSVKLITLFHSSIGIVNNLVYFNTPLVIYMTGWKLWCWLWIFNNVPIGELSYCSTIGF